MYTYNSFECNNIAPAKRNLTESEESNRLYVLKGRTIKYREKTRKI